MATSTNPQVPLGVPDLISRSFGIFFSNFLLFFAISFFPTLVLSLSSLVLFGGSLVPNPDAVQPESIGQALGIGFFVYMILAVIASTLIIGTTTLAAYDTALGNRVNLAAYVARTMAVFFPIFLLGVVYYLMIGFGFALLIVPGLYLAARFLVYTPAILIEGAGFGALGRASALSEGYRWPIAGGMLLLIVMLFLVSIATQWLSPVITGGLGGIAAFVLLQSAGSAITYGVFSAFAALLYARLREIKDGVGIDDLLKVFD